MKPINQPTDIAATDIVCVYSGRPGCACGCRGDYYKPSDKGFRRVVSNALKRIANPEPGDEMRMHEDRAFKSGFAVIENGQHVWTVYWNTETCFKPVASSVEAGWNV